MGKIGKIRPEQLRTAQKILRELPVKDNRYSREVAAAFLEKDLKRVFRKGYTPKELCALLKKAGILIPERLIARYQEPEVEEEGDREVGSKKEGSSAVGNRSLPARQTENVETVKNVTIPKGHEGKPQQKSEPVRYGTFTIIPDIPIGDL